MWIEHDCFIAFFALYCTHSKKRSASWDARDHEAGWWLACECPGPECWTLCWYQVICVESESGGLSWAPSQPAAATDSGSGARVGAEVSYQALIQSSNHHPQCERWTHGSQDVTVTMTKLVWMWLWQKMWLINFCIFSKNYDYWEKSYFHHDY